MHAITRTIWPKNNGAKPSIEEGNQWTFQCNVVKCGIGTSSMILFLCQTMPAPVPGTNTSLYTLQTPVKYFP